MYLTKINLDLTKRTTAKGFYDRGIFHSLLESCFSGERQHPLWRVDKTNDVYSILFLSKDIPNLTRIESAVGKGDGKTIDYDKYLDFVSKDGNVLRFRIAVNPTAHPGSNARIPLNLRRTKKRPRCAEDWLHAQIEKNGAKILKSEVIDHRTICFKRGKGELFKVTYEGTLEVVDSERFRTLLMQGVGPGKAYGCGFITVML